MAIDGDDGGSGGRRTYTRHHDKVQRSSNMMVLTAMFYLLQKEEVQAKKMFDGVENIKSEQSKHRSWLYQQKKVVGVGAWVRLAKCILFYYFYK